MDIPATQKSHRRSHVFMIVFTALLSFVLLLFFSIATSPIYNHYGQDSLEYKMAGSAILDGIVIFRDIFHQKGGLFFFVQAIGELLCRLIGNNRIGTFIIQFFSFFFSMLIVGECAYSYLEKKQKFRSDKKLYLTVMLIVITVSLFWSGTILFGNQVEEFAVLYQMIAVAVCINYCIKCDKNNDASYEFKPIYGFILGICFAVTFWFKPTTAVVICGCVLFVGILLLVKKRFSCALKNIGTGLLGIAVVTVPLLLYYYSKGALGDMLEQCFLFNFKYISAQKSLTNWPIQLFAVYTIIIGLPVISAIFSVITGFHPICVFSLTISASNLVMLLMTSICYIFYIEVEISVLFSVIICLFELEPLKIKRKKLNFAPLCIALCLILSTAFTGFQVIHRYQYLSDQMEWWQETIDDTNAFIKNTDKIIDHNDNNKDILYVLNNIAEKDRYLCYELRRYNFSNYFCLGFFDRVGTQEYIDAFYEDFEASPPKYIVISNNREDISDVYDGVLQKVDQTYTVIYTDDTYSLYELKN